MEPIVITLDAERLRKILNYDPASGIFTWRMQNGPRAVVGAIAGTIDRKGYRRIKIDGQKHAAHRLAWLYMTGEWPALLIDHHNRLRDDNRWQNLRQATKRENKANSLSLRTGHLKGAHRVPAGRWAACIVVGKKKKHLGVFDTEEEANKAYEAAARLHFGEFARAA